MENAYFFFMFTSRQAEGERVCYKTPSYEIPVRIRVFSLVLNGDVKAVVGLTSCDA